MPIRPRPSRTGEENERQILEKLYFVPPDLPCNEQQIQPKKTMFRLLHGILWLARIEEKPVLALQQDPQAGHYKGDEQE